MSASRTLAGSAPFLEANSSASLTAWMLSATMIGAATLAVCQSPLVRIFIEGKHPAATEVTDNGRLAVMREQVRYLP